MSEQTPIRFFDGRVITEEEHQAMIEEQKQRKLSALRQKKEALEVQISELEG